MKYTIRPFKYGPYDYRDAENFLNKMSQEGWEFKTTSKGWLRNWAMFEKAKGENKAAYNIDLEGFMTDSEKEEYYRFYQDLGWHYQDTYNKKLNIFKSNLNNNIPIYSEEKTEYENLKKYGKFSKDLEYIANLSIMAILLYVIYKLIGLGLSFITSYSMIVALTVIMINAAVMLFLNIVYRNNCKKSMEKTGRLPENVLLSKWRVWEVCGENLILLLIGFGTIFGFGYEIWGGGIISGNDLWRFEKVIYFGMALVGFIGMFIINYIYMMKPEKKFLRIVDFIFVFSWVFAFITYLQRVSWNA